MHSDGAAPELSKPMNHTRSSSVSAILTVVIALMIAGILALQVLQIFGREQLGAWLGNAAPGADRCSVASSTCFDTGWQPVSNKTSAIFIYRHQLGTVPLDVRVWFSPGSDGARAYRVETTLAPQPAVNPLTVEARADAVLIHTWAGAPIYAAYDGSTEKWMTFAEGYYRVVARR